MLLREATDASSVIARFGGDEFVVVPASAAIDVEASQAFAPALHERVHKQVVIDGEMLTRTVSIGVAAGVPGRDSTSDLLRRVDQATRSAKNSGGCSRSFQPGDVWKVQDPQRHRTPPGREHR